MNQKQVYPHITDSLNLPSAKALQVQTRCVHEQFFLCGILNEIVYLNKLWSLEEVKNNIEQSVANIDPETLQLHVTD